MARPFNCKKCRKPVTRCECEKKMGRPKQTLSELPEGWDEEVLNLYAEGASDVEVRVMLAKKKGKFSDDLWERWLKEEEHFSRTIKKGHQLSQAWWEKHGRINLHNKDFNSVLWYMNMKNRFGWKDNQVVSSPEGQSVGLVCLPMRLVHPDETK